MDNYYIEINDPTFISFITTCSDSSVKEWDLKTLVCVRSLQGHKGPVNDFKACS